MAKIVIIGAGSHTFSRNLITDVVSYPELQDATISLMDIDEGPLELIAAFAKRLVKQYPLASTRSALVYCYTYYGDLAMPVRTRCSVPWSQANIDYDGGVHFCAYPDYKLGNIKEESFFDIYNGKRARRFRAALKKSPDGVFPGCVRCYQNMLCGKKVKGF